VHGESDPAAASAGFGRRQTTNHRSWAGAAGRNTTSLPSIAELLQGQEFVQRTNRLEMLKSPIGAHKHIFRKVRNLHKADGETAATIFADKTSSIVVVRGTWQFSRTRNSWGI
jgi:hypothetical protein